MKRFWNLVKIMSIVPVMIFASGCMSAWSYKCSEEEIAQKRLIASGDAKAINLYQHGIDARTAIKAIPVENGAGLAIDVTALDALTQHPWRQLGAALLDAGAAYGTYKVGENQGWWNGISGTDSHSSSQNATSGRDSDQVSINGNGNNVNIDQSTSTVNNNTTDSGVSRPGIVVP